MVHRLAKRLELRRAELKRNDKLGNSMRHSGGTPIAGVSSFLTRRSA